MVTTTPRALDITIQDVHTVSYAVTDNSSGANTHDHKPVIIATETEQQGGLIAAHWTAYDPDGDLNNAAYTFEGSRGSGWAPEYHDKSHPSLFGEGTAGDSGHTAEYTHLFNLGENPHHDSYIKVAAVDDQGHHSDPVEINLNADYAGHWDLV